ncbi:MAG: glycerol-3-phosphate 1-O-acyltransferase PlsY [Oscillospiraceae bacterium]|jgi:glycerol-3-phosphate acyltransferase PlsY|nr:glycerol-3-phosphate 1-O-acyltransferase PlsY [Oscillospiraceae bacterium]
MSYAFVFLAAYLLGNVNPSIIFSRLIHKKDIREMGSKNAGFTNTLRCLGPRLGSVVLTLDVLKGVAAVLLAGRFLSSSGFIPQLAGLAVVIGHIYPAFFGFRGGKGVATSAGVILALQWPVFLMALAMFGVVLLSTRYMSLASMTGALFLPFASVIYARARGLEVLTWNLLFYAIITVTVIIMHRPNIKRLISRTENKLWGKKK